MFPDRAIAAIEYDRLDPEFLDPDLALELEDHRTDCWRQANPRSSFCNCREMQQAQFDALMEAGYSEDESRKMSEGR